jgi:hypothetical protein
MRQPPLVLTFLSVFLLALGTSGGAVMSLLRPQIQRYSTERILAAPAVHSLSGSLDYDAEVVGDIVFTIEAGLSFFHTHAEGMGMVLLFGATAVASLVGRRWLRGALQWLLGLAFLFPIGYLAYSALVLLYGKDAGIALAEQTLLIPFGSAAILGLLIAATAFLFAGRRRRATLAREAETGGPGEARLPGWRPPPRPVILAAAVLITLSEFGGASMARFKPEIAAFATARILERPQVHGLVGLADVDAEALELALVKLDGGLRLFHLHGEGMGLMIFGVGLVVASLVARARFRAVLYGLSTVGGFAFPFGYLLGSALIPFVGVDPARTISAAAVLIPSGGLALIALWALTVLLGRDLVRGGGRGQREVDRDGERVMRLPPRVVVVAAVFLLVLAEVGGGAMVKLKIALDRANLERIQARPQIHGLVGVREVDGPVIDRLLSRADFAIRLFHLHGEGMALVMFAGSAMIRNAVPAAMLSPALYAMLAVGGFLYPFGYLAWSGMIPFLGLERSKDLAESFVWIPFGGAALGAMALVSLLLGREVHAARRERAR